MKIVVHIRTLIITVISLFVITLVQGQNKADRLKSLNFTVSYEPINSKKIRDSFRLVIRADGKTIKKAERVYIRVIDPGTGKNIFVKAINIDILEGRAANTDTRFKMVEMNKKELRLNFGTFKKGEYEVLIKIKDSKQNMFFDRKKITLLPKLKV